MITVQLAEGSVIKVRDLVGRDVSRGDRVGVTLRGEVVVFDG
jgi:hypothetical protein